MPHSPFLFFEDSTLTYSEVNKHANRIAHWAISQNIHTNGVVALMMENRPEFIAIWIGLNKIGVVTAFINYTLTGRALEHVLKISQASHFIIGTEHVAAFVEHYGHNVTKDRVLIYQGQHGKPSSHDWIKDPQARSLDAELERTQNDKNPTDEYRAKKTMTDPMWYIYTSGTTGFPKAALVNGRNVFARSNMITYFSGATSNDRVYVCLPLYHSSGSVTQLT